MSGFWHNVTSGSGSSNCRHFSISGKKETTCPLNQNKRPLWWDMNARNCWLRLTFTCPPNPLFSYLSKTKNHTKWDFHSEKSRVTQVDGVFLPCRLLTPIVIGSRHAQQLRSLNSWTYITCFQIQHLVVWVFMIPIIYSQWKYKSRKLFIWIWLIPIKIWWPCDNV